MKNSIQLLLVVGTSIAVSATLLADLPAKSPAVAPSATKDIVGHLAKIAKSAVQITADFDKIEKLAKAMLTVQKADMEGALSDKKELDSARVLLIDSLPLLQHALEAVTELVFLTNTLNKDLLSKLSFVGSLNNPKSYASMINITTLRLIYALKVFSGVLKTVSKIDPKKLFEASKEAKEKVKKEAESLEQQIKDIMKGEEEGQEEQGAVPDYPAPQPPAGE